MLYVYRHKDEITVSLLVTINSKCCSGVPVAFLDNSLISNPLMSLVMCCSYSQYSG